MNQLSSDRFAGRRGRQGPIWRLVPSLVALVAVVCIGGVEAAPSRMRIDIKAHPWRSLGKVQLVAGSLRETCTGVLVGVRTVATAAYCLVNVRTGAYFRPSSVTFLLGLERGRTRASRRFE